MKFYKLKVNDDKFNFNELTFNDNLKLSDESKKSLIDYLNNYLEEVEFNTDKQFIEAMSQALDINDKNIGNTIDIYTTNKSIYQMTYLEFCDGPTNFLGTIINNKRKLIRGDIIIYANSLLTTKIEKKDKPIDYITQQNMTMDDIIDIILINYYHTGLCFDGDRYFKILFDNNMIVRYPDNVRGIDLSTLSFRRSDLLNFTIDIFFENTGEKVKEKYNRLLGTFYLQNFNNKIFVAMKSETEKKYDSILDDYINKLISIYDKLCYDDDEMNVPKELKFYDYQSNDKYTNKYIVFDNLYDQIVLKIPK